MPRRRSATTFVGACLLGLACLAPAVFASSRTAGPLCEMDMVVMTLSKHGSQLDPTGNLAVRLNGDAHLGQHIISVTDVTPYEGIFLFAMNPITGQHHGSFNIKPGFQAKTCGGTSPNSTLQHRDPSRKVVRDFEWVMDDKTPVGMNLVVQAMICISLRKWYLVPYATFTVGRDGSGFDRNFMMIHTAWDYFRADYVLYTIWLLGFVLAIAGFFLRYAMEEHDKGRMQRVLMQRRMSSRVKKAAASGTLGRIG